MVSRPVGSLRVTAPPPSRTPSPPPTQTSSLPDPSPPTPPPLRPLKNPPQPSKPTTKPPPKRPRHISSISPPPPTKNLRWTAIALVAELSTTHVRPSAQLADQVAAIASADLCAADPSRSVAAVQRNTRRRVYDALKVMEAAGCIQRDGKSLRWLGIHDLARHPTISFSPKSSHQQHQHPHSDQQRIDLRKAADLRVAICEARRRIARKRAAHAELRASVTAFERFQARKTDQPDESSSSASHSPADRPHRHLSFPFVLVRYIDQTRQPIVKYSREKDTALLTFPVTFRLYSETDVVRMLGERGRAVAAALRKPKRARAAPSASAKPRVDQAKPSIKTETTNLLNPLPTTPSPSSMPPLYAEAPRGKFIDLKKNTIAETADVRLLNVVLPPPKKEEDILVDPGDDVLPEADVEPTVPGPPEEKQPLSRELRMSFATDDNSEDQYVEQFADIRECNSLPEKVFIHGLHARSVEQIESSRDGIDSCDLDRLPDRKKEEFEQDIELACGEELVSPSISDDHKDNDASQLND